MLHLTVGYVILVAELLIKFKNGGIYTMTLLLVVIYISFIGLGLPDSIFGAAWPAIYTDFNLPLSLAGYFSMSVSVCTIISSIFSSRLINRFGTGIITAVSTAMTVIGLFGMMIAPHFAFFFLFAIPLGLGAGAVDSALNNYVALHFNASHMSFLHCFYGVGVSLSPYLMSLALSKDNNWRLGYGILVFIQIIICVLTFLSLPLWNKNTENDENDVKNLSFAKAFRMPKLWCVWLILIGSCSVEYICGSWGSTYLVNEKNVSAEFAARIITFYYLGMTLGRFLSGVLSVRFSARQIINAGKCFVLAAVVALMFPINSIAAGACLFLIGLGNGPLYPNVMHLTPHNFSPEISQSIMGLQMAGAYIGIMLMPALFGFSAQMLGMNIFPIFLIVMLSVLIISDFVLGSILKREKNCNF